MRHGQSDIAALPVFPCALYKAIGKKRLYPLIARGEYNAENAYTPIAEKYPEAQSVKADEKRHGDTVLALLQESESKAPPVKAILAGAGIVLFAASGGGRRTA